MPSHRRGRSYSRERSASRSRSRSRGRDDSRSRSRERAIELPNGAQEISESDYFSRSDEFRVWLKDEKHKYMDELSSDKSRKYFRKFVKAWNRGKLAKSLYYGVEPQAASSQTGYKWAFASKTSKADSDALRVAREEVGAATHNRSHNDVLPLPNSNGGSSSSGRIHGPTLPSQSDLIMAREDAEAHRTRERDLKRKRDKKEGKEKVEDMVGPKEVGKEGMLEKKRAKREADRAFRERGDDGLDMDDSTLMGGGDSFRERVARRDAARKRVEEKKFGGKEERDTAARERAEAIRQKEKSTMDMLMQLAKQKYG